MFTVDLGDQVWIELYKLLNIDSIMALLYNSLLCCVNTYI